jgi:hypothetical protein
MRSLMKIVRPGLKFKVRSHDYSPHMPKGTIHEVKKVVGSRLQIHDCTAHGLGCLRCTDDGWYWDDLGFDIVRAKLASGDRIVCFSGDMSHFKGDGKNVYTVKAVFNMPSASGHQKFLVEECEKDRQAGKHACSCRDGREFVFNHDFDFADPGFQPVTLEEAKRAKNLPTADDVASFFGLKP